MQNPFSSIPGLNKIHIPQKWKDTAVAHPVATVSAVGVAAYELLSPIVEGIAQGFQDQGAKDAATTKAATYFTNSVQPVQQHVASLASQQSGIELQIGQNAAATGTIPTDPASQGLAQQAHSLGQQMQQLSTQLHDPNNPTKGLVDQWHNLQNAAGNMPDWLAGFGSGVAKVFTEQLHFLEGVAINAYGMATADVKNTIILAFLAGAAGYGAVKLNSMRQHHQQEGIDREVQQRVTAALQNERGQSPT